MENYSYHIPFYVVTNGIATSGHSADLKPGQVGLFDRQNFSVATGSGNGKEFYLAQGVNGGFDWNGLPLTESVKSPFFFGASVENMYVSYPKRAQNEEWVIGFNGSTSSKGLTFEKGKATRVKFLFHGQPSLRFFGGPKEYLISYTPQEDCTAACAEGNCPDPIVDCLQHTQAIVNKINEHVELRKFGVRAQLVNAPYTALTANMTKYTLSIVDNGDTLALQAVQAQAPAGTKVERISREGLTSVYQVCRLTTAGAPANFSYTGKVNLAICGSCSAYAGSTLVGAKDVYLIERVVTPSTDLTTANAQDTYADTVGTAYDASVVDADKTFVGLDNGVATVEVKFAAGTVVAALVSDKVTFVRAEPAVCTQAAPSSTAWATGTTGVSSSRTLRINSLNRQDCGGADRIADLTAILAGVEGVDTSTITKIAGTGCADDYTVQQNSSDCLSEAACLSNQVTFTYAELPSFLNRSWEVVPATITENANRKCGIRVSAGYPDPKNSNETFDITSYYETGAIKFELSLLNDSDSACDVSLWPTVLQTKEAKYSRQSGEEIIREVIYKDAAYLRHVHQFENNPLIRERFDINVVGRVDRNAFYKLYYVTFTGSYGASTWRTGTGDKFTAVFAFKENDPNAQTFEDQILKVLTAKSDVAMHIAD
jgi:hypothetical protein